MTGGTYTLVLERSAGGPIEVGALGTQEFPAGWYSYTGSALGSGGFARVDRHRAVAAGENEARHWHVDYLLGDDVTAVDRVVTTEAAVECAVAEAIEGELRPDDSTDEQRATGPALDGFGCSDCDCRSHLGFDERRDRLLTAVERAHERATDGR
jgi:endonuclease-3